ncbi:uncharacterized protein G2W53_022784 [Senna tora]|uniref:Uncharacterized protein n=1 Tax=Senna tora TaxID=362788 RepID=A0A834TMM5_9FABA|nr:uncharacterized protein G2W53_022784 [Senna tora]
MGSSQEFSLSLLQIVLKYSISGHTNVDVWLLHGEPWQVVAEACWKQTKTLKKRWKKIAGNKRESYQVVDEVFQKQKRTLASSSQSLLEITKNPSIGDRSLLKIKENPRKQQLKLA